VDELIEHSEVLVATREAEKLQSRIAELGKRVFLVDLNGRKQRGKKQAALAKPTPALDANPAPEEPVLITAQ